MRALVISHQRDAGPGVFAPALTDAGHELDVWHFAETDQPPTDPHDYDAVLTFGGAMHVDQASEHPWIDVELALLAEMFERGTPLLGVCLGAQLLAAAVGGSAARASEPEIGWFDVEVTPEGIGDPVIGPLAPRFEAFEWHSYECRLPDDAVVLARTPVCVQAFRIGRSAWGIQFHAEVTSDDARRWIDDYHSDDDAVRIGIDPAALHAETERKIGAFNALGRELCRRWAQAALVRA
jgi:GMP synthase (glutamine-hydrolysing)